MVGASVLGRDVTEQREKELRFTELFETLQEGVYFSTPEGQLLDANPALVSMLGYEEKGDSAGGGTGSVEFRSGQNRCWGGRSMIAAAYARARSSCGERMGRRRCFWIRRGRCGTRRATSSATRERWWTSPRSGTMERQLAQQEEFRARLLESFPDLILVVDLEERYTFVSSRARDLLGYAAERHAGEEDFRSGRSFAGPGLALSRRGFGQAGLLLRRNTGRSIATETGGRCARRAANWSMPRQRSAA